MTAPQRDTGSPWNIPYPLDTDSADDPAQSRARAEKIHADLNAVKFSTDAPMVAWTPAGLTGITLGNGTMVGKYARVGSLVHAHFQVTAAGASPTTAWSGAAGAVNLPVAPAVVFAIGLCMFNGTSMWRPGIVHAYGTASVASFSAIRQSDLSLQPPSQWGAWAAGNLFEFSLTYVVAPLP